MTNNNRFERNLRNKDFYISFNFNFANNTILSCFFFSLSIIDLYVSTPAVIAQIFNPIAKLVIPIGIPTKKAKAEIETDPVIVEITVSKWSI